MLEQEAFDVDGNLVRQSRRLAAAYATTPDWAVLDEPDDPADMDAAAAALLEAEVFTTEASFDAMGRPVTQTTPDGSVMHLGYGDAGHLETVAANVRGAVTSTSFVTDLRYDARGQRTLVVYGNGTRTSYAYDPLTFRLTRLRTERAADGHLHQDLRYTFDPAGNITEIRDRAQPVVFTSNAAVSADQRFSYDALYRLVHAEGREHGSQGQPIADDFVPRAAPDDPTGLRLYTEQYLYDAVGNILQLQHAAVGGSWTRGYHYATHDNRLLASSLPGDTVGVPATYSATYAHDAHGNMTAMPHLAAIDWDHADRMQHADLGGGGDVYFQYDAAGNRVRKVRVNTSGTAANERVYLGAVELYRERAVDGPDQLGAIDVERQTLHIADDTGRIVMVETLTIDGGSPVSSSANISRYQYGNHLGTVALELDDAAAVISYEEFHPYGTSAYRAVDSSIEVSAKRYRYTGKERDEETGLDHMGARHYAPWLGRWTSSDPIGIAGGINVYAYAANGPTRFRDPSGLAPGDGSEDRSVPKGAFMSNEDGTISEGNGPSLTSEPPPEVPEAGAKTPSRTGNPSDGQYQAVRRRTEGIAVEQVPGVMAGAPVARGALEAIGELAVSIAEGVGEFAWNRATHPEKLFNPVRSRSAALAWVGAIRRRRVPLSISSKNNRPCSSADASAATGRAPSRPRRRMTWAELMRRVFALDVLGCPVCQGPMKIIAESTQPEIIERFLAALDLPTKHPELERARPPPQGVKSRCPSRDLRGGRSGAVTSRALRECARSRSADPSRRTAPAGRSGRQLLPVIGRRAERRASARSRPRYRELECRLPR